MAASPFGSGQSRRLCLFSVVDHLVTWGRKLWSSVQNLGFTLSSIITEDVESTGGWTASSPRRVSLVVPTSREGLQQDGLWWVW